MYMVRKKGGRPPKEEVDKLNRSINLKLTKDDYTTIQKRAEKFSLSPTQYARIMTLKGVIKSRFTIEELDLMRKIAGISNNLNQIARGLNSDLRHYQMDALKIIICIKKMLYDSKEY